MDFFRNLLDDRFMPHGHCYYWQPEILWLHVGSDAGIALAYFSIPLAILYFLRQRPEVGLSGVFYLFAAFILLCGTTHVFGIITTWEPAYRLEGLVKLATAGVSLATAAILWPLMPKALTIPSRRELEELNQRLRQEISERQGIEQELRDLNASLEKRIHSRTQELARYAHQIEGANHQLARSNQDLDDFAQIVSHDLRAPLRAIASLAGWLETDHRESLGEEGRRLLENLIDRTRRMDALIAGVLTYSRAARGGENPEHVDTRPLIEAVIESLGPPAGIQVTTEGDFPEIVYDRTQITQVFQNLIGNAIDHMNRPDGQVTVSCEDREDRWCFHVADTGPGIEEPEQRRIFKPFRNTHSGNAGVGLGVVKKIVERSGGDVWVRSTVGVGSTFSFTVPKREDDPPTDNARDS